MAKLPGLLLSPGIRFFACKKEINIKADHCNLTGYQQCNLFMIGTFFCYKSHSFLASQN